jgi:radical SAM protein with 4Fe4S-binding SPASM domain
LGENEYFKIITRENRRLLRDIVPLAKPLSIFIEITNICNFRCAPCVHGSEKTRNDLKPFKHMEMDLYKKIIYEIKNWEGVKLSLLRLAVLGEPLAHPQFVDMVRIAKENNVANRVDTFSNGSLLTEQLCEKIVEYELDYIRFSIYSVLNEKHKRVTQTNIDVKKIRDNIATLKKIKVNKNSEKPYILVKMFDSYDEENEIFKSMYEGIADEIGFEKVHNATQYSGNDLINAYYQNDKLEDYTLQEYKKNLNNFITCPRPFMALVINNIGDVLMCTHDAPKATKIGNCQNNTLEEIWNSDELYQFRKMQLSRDHSNILCKNCDWYKLFPMEDNIDGLPIEIFKPKKESR